MEYHLYVYIYAHIYNYTIYSCIDSSIKVCQEIKGLGNYSSSVQQAGIRVNRGRREIQSLKGLKKTNSSESQVLTDRTKRDFESKGP